MPGALDQTIAAINAPWDRPDSPGGCLGIIRDGKLAFRRGFRRASRGHDIALNSSSVVHVASKAKQFTAAGIALKIEAGRLNSYEFCCQIVDDILGDFWSSDSEVTA